MAASHEPSDSASNTLHMVIVTVCRKVEQSGNHFCAACHQKSCFYHFAFVAAGGTDILLVLISSKWFWFWVSGWSLKPLYFWINVLTISPAVIASTCLHGVTRASKEYTCSVGAWTGIREDVELVPCQTTLWQHELLHGHVTYVGQFSAPRVLLPSQVIRNSGMPIEPRLPKLLKQYSNSNAVREWGRTA